MTSDVLLDRTVADPKVLAGKPVEAFTAPEGVIFARIDPRTGLLAGPGSKDSVFESFLDGTAPKEYSPTTGEETGEAVRP